MPSPFALVDPPDNVRLALEALPAADSDVPTIALSIFLRSPWRAC